MDSRSTVLGLTVGIVVLTSVSMLAQPPNRRWPSAPRDRGGVASGLPVSPFFEGWYENPDGTFTLSFGHFNRNTEETLTLPPGPDNFITPAEYDGVQPTMFAPGRGTGVFTVTVPSSFDRNDRVVWTLRNADGSVHSVPGKIGIEAYQLHHAPMAMGSLPALLKLNPDGPELWGPMTIVGDPRAESAWPGGLNQVGSIGNPLPVTASVGTPLTLTVWVRDRLAPDAEREPVAGGATWATHRGPSLATFSDVELEPADDGRATTTATFGEPGEYILRVRADNFNPVDSSPGDQCCWTNGYLKVTVSR